MDDSNDLKYDEEGIIEMLFLFNCMTVEFMCILSFSASVKARSFQLCR